MVMRTDGVHQVEHRCSGLSSPQRLNIRRLTGLVSRHIGGQFLKLSPHGIERFAPRLLEQLGRFFADPHTQCRRFLTDPCGKLVRRAMGRM